jgi:methionyl-tRNA formyltransferase
MKIVIIGNGKIASDCIRIMLEKGTHAVLHVFYEQQKNPEPAALMKTISEFQLNASSIHRIHDEENVNILANLNPDWIFNINCYQYLRPQILAAASKGVINFHNGPLPLYGGVNISSWPIINGETHHGVTWHLVNEGIDKGDILAQSFFEIGPRWTAAKLMSFCIVEGIQLFEKFWEGWVNGEIQALPQHDQSTYYSLKDTPPNDGYLSWEKSASELDALVRGLHLFPFHNSFGFAKIKISHHNFIIIQTKIESGHDPSKVGQILSLTEKGLVVQCAEDKLHIQTIADAHCQPINWSTFQTMTHLQEGDWLM